MKKNVLALFFIVVCAFIFMGQVGVKSAEHDFGKVKADEYVYHTFEIENSTDGKLIVQNVQAG